MFFVLIQSSISFPEQGWEAILWHNGHEHGKWDELRLDEVDLTEYGAPVSNTKV